ncbi:glycoside hydrolase family 16 protein [Neptunicella sp. SCSIO 80796]|uniref:glycoside hydrolase family 16 protein n=1 Tax=Neptunicella plasticusilytica TaxID=3117012 RepID=UPI003A4E106C
MYPTKKLVSRKFLLCLTVLTTLFALQANASAWVNKSGTTSQTGDVLELVGDWNDIARAEIELDVEQGQTYTLRGKVKNTRDGLKTYIGVLNGTENIEHYKSETTYKAIQPITFVAQSDTVIVYSSVWRYQDPGTGYVKDVELGVPVLDLPASGETSGGGGGSGTGNCDGNYTLCDDFDGSTVDSSKWYVLRKQWGGNGANGGVVEDNVAVSNGNLVLTGLGNDYTGPVRGINKDGSQRSDGKKTGGGIASKDYLGSGIYEVRMKVLPELGAVSTIWTFHYQEFYPGDQEYIDNNGTGSYWASNHEIDIEIPGRPNAAFENISFDYLLANTWRGERESEYDVNYVNSGDNADGQFHDYKFIWHTGGNGETPRVEFYRDGQYLYTETDHIPNYKGRLWLAVWFANGWAGVADFDSDNMVIDYFRFTAFDEPNDAAVAESYPCAGLIGCVE